MFDPPKPYRFWYEVPNWPNGDLHLRFPHVERRSSRRPARQNVADRYYQPNGSEKVSAAMVEGNGRVSGIVKFFNPDKGYGFIRRDGGQDVFVHANELRRSGIVDLTPIITGAKLEFDVEQVEKKGPKAINIMLMPSEPDGNAVNAVA